MPRPAKRELSEESKALLREIHSGAAIGSIEEHVRTYVQTREITDPLKLAYAEMAVNLAKKLDIGAGHSTASINKELRETLNVLAETSDEDDDPLNLTEPM